MMWSRRTAVALMGLGLIASIVGCGRRWEKALPTFPVSGQVFRDGKPLADALVVLHPQQAMDGKIQPARGNTDAEGKFQLSTYNSGDGAAVGDYVVTVEYYEPIKEGGSVIAGPNVLPPEYSLLAHSKIKVHVPEGGTTVETIEVPGE